MVMIEIWRDIDGTNGKYLVSNFGRVKSLIRSKERIINGGKHKQGYPMVLIRVKGKVKYCTVHRLVAKAFIPQPQGKNTVNHKDFNVANNHVNNLEWCTQGYNTRHAHANNRRKNLRGEKHNMNKLKEVEILEIRELVENSDIPASDIARMYGIAASHIWAIKTRKVWGWLE